MTWRPWTLHAFGAALDNPELTVFCVVGDGEAETGPLAGSWHANKFLNPARDGAVLPILALNEYKIANPTILARIPEPELLELMRGYGYAPQVVAGDDPAAVHQRFAGVLDDCLQQIVDIQRAARAGGDDGRPAWPMIVLRTPKGWTRRHRPCALARRPRGGSAAGHGRRSAGRPHLHPRARRRHAGGRGLGLARVSHRPPAHR
ncbi:hypothetical protein GCM10020358_59310 [Amorphoplanes nipponensis]|uniref:Xylulose 5-phosphate/Fructose 6-phosphate phosphoketolase N-terminal domain-containing protein n=1 Tax=Actinoplanes nipponensis TaxID=135950 RepID=A0A919MM02_9ACTN|nr:hypothetical protein Ani05nite_04420 [Actinoplanes nipponensis]